MAAPNWPAIRAGIFAGESGGDYNALFGFSNRDGKPFSKDRLTDMTVDQALQFAAPSGPYGQWVKGQIGRVATPMGAYQVVGTTLRAAKEGLGLSGNERMTPETQDAIGQWILAKQGTGAWEGYRGARDPASFPAQGASLPGKIGGDSMVARDFDPQVAAQTNTPTFGSMAPPMNPPTGIDPAVAQYAFADEKKDDRFSDAGKHFDNALKEYPAPRPSEFPGGPSKEQATGLLSLLKSPNALARMFLQQRMG